MASAVDALFLPDHARPKCKCEICGELFYSADVMTKHVVRCVKKNSGRVEEMHAEARAKEPLADAVDTEAVDWQLKRYGHLLLGR